MNSLFEINRDLRTIKDKSLNAREHAIRKIMVSYGYDHENAEKVYEYGRVENAKQMFGATMGALAAYKFNPIYQEAAHRHLLFRKFWMRFPMQLSVFAFAWYVSIQIPNRMVKWFTGSVGPTHKSDRWFNGNRGVTQELMLSNTDLVGRFRMFENQSVQSAEKDIIKYLHEYSDRPFVKDELVERLRDMERKGHRMRIRRMGKDLDNIFWHFGKIHGLENIVYIDDEQLIAAVKDPVDLQKLVNRVEIIPENSQSFEKENIDLDESMIKFKDAIGKLGLITTDRKRLLSLPIYMAKRAQAPEPKRGQAEFDLFTNLTGQDFTEDIGVSLDKEKKITEFEFEKFLNPALLQRVNTGNTQFKQLIRSLNFSSQTNLERLLENK